MWYLVINSWLNRHQSRDSITWSTVLISMKGIHSMSLYWFGFGQNPLMMCFSGLIIIIYIFDLLEILLSVSNHIQLWSHMVLYYMGSQSTIIFGIKSTLFTLCLRMKLILAHYSYIWCFILYTSYGCFFEGHLRWFNRYLCVVFFTMLIICELQGT